MTMVGTIMPGEDVFGHFVIGADKCAVCGQVGICVKYGPDLKLPDSISVESTILKHVTHSIGITCGDYGKLHRQVTHIRDSISHSESSISIRH